MTNKEKWAGELVEILTANPRGFSVDTSGKPGKCENVIEKCKKCIFGNSLTSCVALRNRWLKEEYVEQIYYLTELEENILRMLDSKWEYMARDENGNLSLFDNEPVKSSSLNIWQPRLLVFLQQPLYCTFEPNIFRMVKWTDSWATSIESLKKLPVLD